MTVCYEWLWIVSSDGVEEYISERAQRTKLCYKEKITVVEAIHSSTNSQINLPLQPYNWMSPINDYCRMLMFFCQKVIFHPVDQGAKILFARKNMLRCLRCKEVGHNHATCRNSSVNYLTCTFYIVKFLYVECYC